ncbi:1-deoxy-D-xylulose-5-phosphate reductoisomerase [Herbinix luporum]|uniref:1-deoxy-D-xylulose 5-phosphate reductoisomerase n=1 Tax=Herbinix luporum TaxID=1679721 RepID=A0A0K8J518_9FIRM|nr:1-deoxy-D-xylulose-5-phosphate reductoisomerase [Herbinix luporum]MDI9487957.1 1-deoxy-D-xylulose-5-phosphate reductoisomerase [Bacillota bacterium]CUH92433.1 1-deoxy-D-xylulose 5-phosphate reductoisomerase [Herbinix luporum]HHT57034.1 1-deoxy-D-xylulose-5-phosphate reductoisomerase [Herbinix luporum]
MKKIAILGSTGSIGIQTLEVAREHKDEIKVVSLVAHSNIDLLEQQIREFMPELVCVYDENKAKQLRENIKDLQVPVETGMDGIIACASLSSADTVVAALVGMIGILPTIEAIKAGKNIALANKETLVTAGHLIMPLCKEKGVKLLPVDSEHSAIFQALNGESKKNIHKIILTASGGPFRGLNISSLKNITPQDALKHPNWSMGNKITIDSATLINKALEVMEAAWLFGVPISQVQVLVHPQSIIHSMVEYLDGSVIAQMGLPDMRLPIQYALFYPDRKEMKLGERLDLTKINQLTFEEADMETFYGLKLGLEAGKLGGSMPTVFNAANEWAVARFLEGKIGFLDIPKLISKAMENHIIITSPSLNEILNTEQETYDFIEGIVDTVR